MTILSEIRKRSWILIAVVAFAMVAFLIDPQQLQTLFGVNRSNVGEVDGQAITVTEYQALLNQMNQNGQNSNAHAQAWDNLVLSKLLEKRYNNLGLRMNDDIFWMYSPISKDKYEEALNDPNSAEMAKNWMNNRKSLEYQIMSNQYLGFIYSGILSNNLEKSIYKKSASEVANIEYIRIGFDEYNKKENYKVTNEDIQKYIDKHKSKFKQPEARSFYATVFKNEPSAEDAKISNANMQSYLNGGLVRDERGEVIDSVAAFTSAKGDSAYVSINSMQPYNPNYLSYDEVSQSLGKRVADWANGASVGQVFGPYKVQNYEIISKIGGKRMTDSIQSKHILISFKEVNQNAKRTGTQARALADSIYKAVTAKPELFDILVQKYSDDAASKAKNGEVGYAKEGAANMDQNYMQYIASNPVGKVGLVQSNFGFHILKATNKIAVKPMKFQLLNLVKQNLASEKTSNQTEAMARQFYGEIDGKKLQDFVNTSAKYRKTAINVENVDRFSSLPQLATDKDNDILKWAFDSERKIGETSFFQTNMGDLVIVYLAQIIPQGIAAPEIARKNVENIVRNEILAEKIAEKINANSKSLEQYAQEFGVNKNAAQVSFSNAVLTGGGREPRVGGAAFGLSLNKVSKAIKGNSGVYVIVVKSRATNQVPAIDDKQLTTMIDGRNKSAATGMIRQTIVNDATIKDNRNNVFK